MKRITSLVLLALFAAAPAYAEVWQARYGVAETFNFKLYNADGTLDVDESDGGTEVSVSCNEGAETTATNDFVDEGTFYSIALTSGEMSCERVAVVVAATTTEVFFIQTSGNASAMTPTYEANVASVTSGAIDNADFATAPGASGGLLISGSNSGTTTLGALTITGATTHTGNVSMAAGLNVTQSTSNTAALVITGNGTGNGATITSGSGSTGTGLAVVSAATNGTAATFAGVGTGNGITATGGATGHGLSGVGGATSGNGIRATGTAGNSAALNLVGQGSAAGLLSTGGATGHGISAVGGATSGNGINAAAATSGTGFTATGVGTTQAGIVATGGSTSSNGITATGGGTGHGIAATSGGGATGNGLTLLSASTNGHGLKSTGTGTGDGAELTAGASGADLDADIAGTLTTVTTATTATNVTTLSSGAITEAAYTTTAGAFASTGVVDQGTAQAATGTTLRLRSAAAFADDELIGAQVLITGGTTGVGQTRTITDYVSSTDTATVATWTTTPTGTITYKVKSDVSPSSGSGASAADVWAYSDRQLTALDEDVTTLDLNASTIGTVTTATNLTTVSSGAISEASYTCSAGSFGVLGIVDCGTAQSATGTTLVLRSALSIGDDAPIGMTLMACGSTQGYCQSRTITDWVSSTDTATVETWTVTPSGTVNYYLVGTSPSSGGGSGLDAAGVRSAIGLSSANLDTQLAGIESGVDVDTIEGTDASDTVRDAPWTASTRSITILDEDSTTIDLNASYVGGVTVFDEDLTTIDINATTLGTVSTATAVTTVNGLAANVITAAATATDFTTEVTSGLATASALTTVAGYVDTEVADILTDTGTTLDDLVDDLETRLTSTRAGYLDNLSAGAVATASALTTVAGYVDTEVAATKAVTDKLDTAMVQDSSVYQFTVNALELGPAGGGGGGTDWNTDEKTAIRAILGVPASGSTPEAPSTGILATIEDQTDEIGTAGAGLTAAGLSAAGVRTAVGLASANLDTQLDALPTAAELATSQGTADDATLAAIAALNNVSTAQVQTSAAAALAAYDPPTKAEQDAGFAALLTSQQIIVGTCDSGSTTTCVDNALTQASADQLEDRLICFEDGWCALLTTFVPGTDTATTTKVAPSTRASKGYTIFPSTLE